MVTAMIVTILSSLFSGIFATIITILVTNHLQKKNARMEYKRKIFRDVIAYRGDISNSGRNSGHFQEAINQVFIAYNDCPKVLKAFEEFRKSTTAHNQNVISDLLGLIKAMALVIKVDYSFANDDLFTRPIVIDRGAHYD